MKSLSSLLRSRRALRRGMTLTELMIALSLTLAVSGAASWFLVESTRTSLRSMSNIDNDLEQWNISNRLLIDSKLANAVTIYNKYEVASFDSATGLGPGERGNFLVLSQSDPVAGTSNSQFKKLWGYVYDSTAKTLSKFEWEVTGTDLTDAKPLVEILKARYSSFTLRTMATDITLVDSGVEAFLVREKGRQANLVFRRTSGKHKKTTDYRMFEISFYTRK